MTQTVSFSLKSPHDRHLYLTELNYWPQQQVKQEFPHNWNVERLMVRRSQLKLGAEVEKGMKVKDNLPHLVQWLPEEGEQRAVLNVNYPLTSVSRFFLF